MDYGEAEWLFTKRSLAKTCLTPFSMLWAPQREQYFKKNLSVFITSVNYSSKKTSLHTFVLSFT